MTSSFLNEKRIVAGDEELAYREVGSGEPLVFVHGFPLSSLTWRKVVPTLAQNYRCIALDLPGSGGSLVGPEVPLNLMSFVRVLGDFLDAIQVERSVVIAHDTGSTIARSFAIERPRQVVGLVLADGDVPGYHPPVVLALKLGARIPGSRSLYKALLSSRRLAKTRASLGQLFADLAAFDFDEFFDSLIKPLANDDSWHRCCHRMTLEFLFRDSDAALSGYDRLTMPKCLIWGEENQVFPLAQGKRLLEMLPDPVALEPVARAGLLVHEERPEAWIQIVRKFLARGNDSRSGL